MALPLPVQIEPVQQPLAFPVGAEILLLYPEAQAASVAVDGYLPTYGQTVTEYPGGIVFEPGGGTETIPAEDCGDIQVVGTGGGGFTTVTGESTLLLSWLDVADFFWWFPDGTPVDDTYTPPVPTTSIDAGSPCPPSEALASALCPPAIINASGDVVDQPQAWDEEGGVWDGGGVWL